MTVHEVVLRVRGHRGGPIVAKARAANGHVKHGETSSPAYWVMKKRQGGDSERNTNISPWSLIACTHRGGIVEAVSNSTLQLQRSGGFVDEKSQSYSFLP